MKNIINLLGQRFGKLTVISKAGISKHGSVNWLCKCDCGNETIVNSNNLRRGHTLSCGCYQREQAAIAGKKTLTIHGKAKSRLYHIWIGMKQRCYNNKSANFKRYGGRGIYVCDEWKNDYQSFYDWSILNGYDESLTIDRINNDKEYSPQNCRWITIKEQGNNRSTNRYITINNQTKTVAQWAEISGIRTGTLYKRLDNGIEGEKLLLPVGELKND